MKRLLHIVLVLVAVAACQGPRIIPKSTLTDIYEDMFLADQIIRERNIPPFKMDTLLVYEAVFNKYGYDTDDYLYSVRHYLKDPERFAKVFEEVSKRLDGKVKALDKLIEQENLLANKMAKRYPLVDSLLAPFSEEAVFVGLARVERDSSRYPAWFRLKAVQEDTLMVPVDSVDARMARKARLDSLAAARDTVVVAKNPLRLPPPEKPLREPPKERLQRPMREIAVEREKIVEKEVIEAEEADVE